MKQALKDILVLVVTICLSVFLLAVVAVWLCNNVVIPAYYHIMSNQSGPETDVWLEADETLGESYVKIAIEESIF